MKRFLSRSVAPFLWTHVLRSKRFEYLKECRRWQWETLEVNRRRQDEKLFLMIDYAVKHIPYYARIAQEHSIVPRKETIGEDLKKFPVLTKEIIRREGRNLVNPSVRAKRNTSGGTTGEPVVIYQDQESRDWGAATKELFYEWAGRRTGEYMAALWGSERDTLQGGSGFRGVLVKYFTNTEFLNTFRMTPSQMEAYLEFLRERSPKLVLAYVQSVAELARFALERGVRVTLPNVMTSAGNLYPETQALIEKVFRSHVFNRYGSREVGDMACSCDQNRGLHLNIFHHYFEVLDAHSAKVGPSDSGSVHITTLNNYAMPLIRYRIGDVSAGVEDQEPCPCGRGLPRITRVLGRDVGLFHLQDGTIVDGEFFTHLFYFRPWVRQFQVIQEDFRHLKVLVSLSGPIPKVEKEEINEAIFVVMGRDCKIEWVEVSDIPPSPSGKFEFTVSKVRH